MVRLADLHPDMAKTLLGLELPQLAGADWITPPPLNEATIAIVTTAGLSRRDDRPFTPGALEYRLIPGDTKPADLLMSHLSVNFDRSGWQQDHNIAIPIDRLRELADVGEIGGVAPHHYSFMGAQREPARLEAVGEEVGRLLREAGVDAAFLTPV